MTQAAAPMGADPAYPGTGVHPDLLPVGTVVCGYRLLRHVATGSFGSVWQVESVHCPGSRYALKFSLYAPTEHTVADARAAREVQLLQQAAHENVVRVVSHGRWKSPDMGQHYVVLEWVEGGTLWRWAGETRPHARQVVRLCQKLARALQRAHEAGVVHRDVKPDNVLVRAEDGEPFLSDFGVGSARGAFPLTLGVAQPGTLPFLSPQVLATHLPGATPHPAQPADDWYALGVVLYVLLTDVLPYPENVPADVLAQWMGRCKPVAPHQLNPRVPPALGQVALRLLGLEPHQRYPDGQAVCSALEQALATATAPETPLLPGPAPEMALTLPPTTGDGPAARDPRVLDAHVFRREGDPDEERLEQVRTLRDTLLRTRAQRRPPRSLRRAAALARSPRARQAAAAVLLVGMLLASWELGRRSHAAPDMAASDASSHLASPDAGSPQEGHSVKTPPAPVPPSSATVPPRTSDSRTLAALCAAGLATACSSVPIRPTQKACPPQAMAAMQQRNWDSVNLFVDPNTVPYTRHTGDQIPMRPGPVIHGIWEDEGFRTDPGLAGLLHGYAFYAEDGRIVLRYTEVELPSGERVPVCFAVKNDEGTYDVRRREPDGTVYNIQTGWKVRVFPD